MSDLKIGFLGGTGKCGRGLALRWIPNHEILIGSRSKENAISIAEKYAAVVIEHYGKMMSRNIVGMSNHEVAKVADVLVFTIPYENLVETMKSIKSFVPANSLIISPVIPIIKGSEGFVYAPYNVYDSTNNSYTPLSAAEVISREFPSNKIVSGFHTLSARVLSDLNTELNLDVLLAGDDSEAITTVSNLVKEIPMLRPIHVGPIRFSNQVECMTPLLLNIAKNNMIKDPSIKIA